MTKQTEQRRSPGRPSKGETIRKQMLFKTDLVEKIRVYQHEQMLNSFTAAVMELVKKGLGESE